MPATAPATIGFPPTPLPNTYWVSPGRILAGEYPGAPSRGETLERLGALLEVGVQLFIDLTQMDEMPEYAPLLREIDASIVHRRFPIIDHGLPESSSVMRRILDAIDRALQSGQCVYIHCRAGIGRTGTVVGCHLVRNGQANAAVLAHLADLWQQSARSSRWPAVPETEEQCHYVANWSEPQSTSVQDRAVGILVGLAAGEMACSSSPATHVLPHTAMTLCLADSLLACGKCDAKDQMQRYLRWVREQPAGSRPDIPPELQRALGAFQFSRKVFAGSHDPANHDSHSLPRTAAVALFHHDHADQALTAAAETSRTTQQSPVVLDACRLFTALLIDAMSGQGKQDLLAFRSGAALRTLRRYKLKREILALLDGGWRSVQAWRSDSLNVLSVLSMALRGLDSTENFQDALQFAGQVGDNTGTVGAVCGALAGAYYGVTDIPPHFRQNHHRQQGARDLDLETIAKNLAIE
jgi:ADP-ribosylglycohydrolase